MNTDYFSPACSDRQRLRCMNRLPSENLSPAQQIERQRDATKEAGKKARESFEAYKNDPSNSKKIAENAEAVQRTDNVIRDMERGIQRGFYHGGKATKKSRKKRKKSK